MNQKCNLTTFIIFHDTFLYFCLDRTETFLDPPVSVSLYIYLHVPVRAILEICVKVHDLK